MRSLCLLITVAGCSMEPLPPPAETDVTLARFQTFHLHATEQSIQIVLGDLYLRDGSCPLIDAEVNARLGGVNVPLVQRGGKIGEEAGDDVADNVCGAPMFRLDMPPPDGASLLDLSDPAAEFRCQLPDLKAIRQAAPVPPTSGDWEWRAGEEVALQWSPGSDLGVWKFFSVALLHISDADATAIDGTAVPPDVAFDGDVMRFTVPAVRPGSYKVDIGPALAPVHCNSQSVRADIDASAAQFGFAHPVTIAP